MTRHPVDPTGPLTRGSIPDADLDRLIDATRRPGRPDIGQPINVRLGDDLLARVDQAAEQAGESRAQTIRRLITTALD